LFLNVWPLISWQNLSNLVEFCALNTKSTLASAYEK
jgi:hypothetical protein